MIRVDEIFGPTVQGEGCLIGRPTVFVRLGGCDYRCAWCDTLHAVLPQYRGNWQPMGEGEILERVDALAGRPVLVTVSGGNPALYDLSRLLALGHERGHAFALETQGSIPRPWFAQLDYLTLSPKPPSSGMATKWERLDACVAAGRRERVTFKVVVFDEADYRYATDVRARYPDYPFFLSVGNEQVSGALDKEALLARLRWLVETALADGWYDVTILPQLHVLIWGNKRGV